MKDNDITVIIPAAGVAKRMKVHGAKSLIDLGYSDTILSRQLRIIRHVLPQAEIILVTGFEADKVYRFIPSDVKVVENHLHQETNVAYSISLGLKACINKRVLVVYGDLIFNKEALTSLSYTESEIVVDNCNRMKKWEVGLTHENGYAIQFCYDLPTKWAHIVYLQDKELELFKKYICNPEYKKFFGYEILNMILASGCKLRLCEAEPMRILEIDTINDLDGLSKLLSCKRQIYAASGDVDYKVYCNGVPIEHCVEANADAKFATYYPQANSFVKDVKYGHIEIRKLY